MKELADILHAVDRGKLALLTLLDLSAASDKFDHVMLLYIYVVLRFRMVSAALFA